MASKKTSNVWKKHSDSGIGPHSPVTTLMLPIQPQYKASAFKIALQETFSKQILWSEQSKYVYLKLLEFKIGAMGFQNGWLILKKILPLGWS